MKDKQKFWFFDPREHGGEANMYIYFASLGLAAFAVLVWLIKEIFFYAE